MLERGCGDETIATGKTTSELKQLFPNVRKSKTAWKFKRAVNPGVYILDLGTMRMLKINGPCPNIENGECKLANRCLANGTKE